MKKTVKEMRNTNRYIQWVNKCMKRDWNKCQVSWTSKNLHVHHIESMAKLVSDYNNAQPSYKKIYEDKIWRVDNWITISEEIHKEFHRKYSKKSHSFWIKEWEEFYKEWKEENSIIVEADVKEYWMTEIENEKCIPLLITQVSRKN